MNEIPEGEDKPLPRPEKFVLESPVERDQLDSFADAFRYPISGLRDLCDCGLTYYDQANDYDWEEGEFEYLTQNVNAIHLDHTVTSVRFYGRNFVEHCDCWKPMALKLVRFFHSHHNGIARYYEREAQRNARAPHVTNQD